MVSGINTLTLVEAAEDGAVPTTREARIERLSTLLSQVEAHINSVMLERQTHVHMLLCCLVSRHHMALVGKPGAAKSMMVDMLAHCIAPGTSGVALVNFKAQGHPFMKPEELYGGVDMAALKNNTLRYHVRGMLPEAHVARMDEAFKMSPSLTHTMLALMNERQFKNGPDMMESPLITMIATSNELPTAPEQAAFRDRYLVWMETPRISREGRPAFLAMRRQRQATVAAAPPTLLTLDDLEEAHALVRDVQVPIAIDQAMLKLWEEMDKAGIDVSERRVEWCYDLLTAQALLDGRDVVEEDDLEVLQHCLWQTPDQRPQVIQAINGCMNAIVGQARNIADQLQGVYDEWKRAEVAATTAEGRVEAAVEARKRFVAQGGAVESLYRQAKGEGAGVKQIERIKARLRDQLREINTSLTSNSF